ncbi:MAG: 16S rRNA (adenine(1518)-N(6)/adenine(1519)-N(6))-dimethyltransferase RsmA [Pseudomonadota bacterium]
MRARKRFGQHFLSDPAVLDRIDHSLHLAPDDLLLEIGPGQGALTALFYGRCQRYRAIEIDRDLVPLLRARYPELEVLEADVLRVDLATHLADGRYRVVGNLPYNISTPLLGKLFELGQQVRDLHIMLQQEVAERLAAEPGTKAYGRLSVVAQARCAVDVLFSVPPSAFTPPPAVESAVLALHPQPAALSPAGFACLDQALRLAFQQRRKRIANALKPLELDWDALPIERGDRADQITVENYLALARWLEQRDETTGAVGLA